MAGYMLQCCEVRCYAVFEVFAEQSDHGVTHCRFCGSELMDLSFFPTEMTPEEESVEAVQVVTRRGPGAYADHEDLLDVTDKEAWRTRVRITRAIEAGAPVELRHRDATAVLVSREDFERLVAEVSLGPVVVRRQQHGWWTAELDALDARSVGQGLDDALRGLVATVRSRTRELLEGQDEQRERYLPLALRVWFEDCRRRLEMALEEAAVLDDEHSALPSPAVAARGA